MNSLTLIIWIILILGGYLLGSIHFCRILGLIFCHVDICAKSYDRNPGAANAFWHCGKKIGIAGLILDILKGFLPVFIAIQLAQNGFIDIDHPLFILVLFAPVLGHAFSIFNKFKGGKCISTTFGILLALCITNVNYYLFPIFAFADLFFSYIKKILPGNLRALVFYCILIFCAIPICIYHNQFTILGGVVLISFLAILKHLPIYTPEEKQKRKSRKKAI